MQTISRQSTGHHRHRVPEELRARPQWAVHDLIQRPHKLDKPPIAGAKNNDPDTWREYTAALALQRNGKRRAVSFVLSPADPYTCLELDHCRDPETGEIAGWAQRIIERFGPTYVEVSVSGTGLHVWVLGTPPGPDKHPSDTKYPDFKGGVYSRFKFVVMTGNVLVDAPIADRQEELSAWYAETFPAPIAQTVTPRSDTTFEDDVLWERMRTSTHGGDIEDLRHGNTSRYGGDHSAADQALCNHLAWWTDRKPDQMDRMFRSTGLMRPKWERQDYRERTIRNAIESCAGGYDPTQRTAPVAPQPAAQPDDRDALVARLLAENAQLQEELRQAQEVAMTATMEKRNAYEWQQKYNACAERNEAMRAVIANPHLDPADKIIGLATLQHMNARETSPKHTDPELGTRINVQVVARLGGMSPDTAGKRVKKLADAGVFKRSESSWKAGKDTPPITNVWLKADGTLVDRTRALADVVVTRKHGGLQTKTKKLCEVCGSDDLHHHSHVECHQCGHREKEHVRPVDQPESCEPQLAAQNNTTTCEPQLAVRADTPPTVDATPPKQQPKEWVIPPAGPGITDMSTLWDDIPPAEIYRPVRTVPIRGWGAS